MVKGNKNAPYFYRALSDTFIHINTRILPIRMYHHVYQLFRMLEMLKCSFKASEISKYFSHHSSSFTPTIPLNDSAICLSSSILANFCRSLFLRLDLPDAIPPFLPISRSSSGVRSVFGIKFEPFTNQSPSRASFGLRSRFKIP